jgi:hypothetical protein
MDMVMFGSVLMDYSYALMMRQLVAVVAVRVDFIGEAAARLGAAAAARRETSPSRFSSVHMASG